MQGTRGSSENNSMFEVLIPREVEFTKPASNADEGDSYQVRA